MVGLSVVTAMTRFPSSISMVFIAFFDAMSRLSAVPQLPVMSSRARTTGSCFTSTATDPYKLLFSRSSQPSSRRVSQFHTLSLSISSCWTRTDLVSISVCDSTYREGAVYDGQISLRNSSKYSFPPTEKLH